MIDFSEYMAPESEWPNFLTVSTALEPAPITAETIHAAIQRLRESMPVPVVHPSLVTLVREDFPWLDVIESTTIPKDRLLVFDRAKINDF